MPTLPCQSLEYPVGLNPTTFLSAQTAVQAVGKGEASGPYQTLNGLSTKQVQFLFCSSKWPKMRSSVGILSLFTFASLGVASKEGLLGKGLPRWRGLHAPRSLPAILSQTAQKAQDLDLTKQCRGVNRTMASQHCSGGHSELGIETTASSISLAPSLLLCLPTSDICSPCIKARHTVQIAPSPSRPRVDLSHL